MSPKKVLLLFLVLFSVVHLGVQLDCNLNDVQKTRGFCTEFVNCTFALSNLRAGVQPKICSGSKNLVCCPTEPTLGVKKCAEWEMYLKVPKVGFFQPLPEPVCTLDNNRGFITGGRDAKTYEFPHAVAIGFGPKSDIKWHCAGTLISNRWVMSAAHCINSPLGKASHALVGDITLYRETSIVRKVLNITETVMHPKYRPPLKYNDIALFKLSEDVEISRYLYPACLPDPLKRQIGPVFEAVGWGLLGHGEEQAAILQAVNLTSFKRDDCQGYYADTPDSSLTLPNGITRTQICAGDQDDGGKDTCNGDSGGGLTVNGKLKCIYHVVGITSFGSKFCGYGTPGVYTRVQSYLEWIEKTVWGGENSIH